MKHIYFLPFLFLILSLTGCEGNTPLQEIKSNEISSTLTSAYWANEYDKNSNVWKKAIQFCLKHNEKPNCGPVIEVFVIKNGATTAPEIGHSGNMIILPTYKNK